MRFPALIFLILLLTIHFVPDVHAAQAGASLPMGLGQVSAFTLPNGMQVLVAPSHAADLVALDIWVGAGTRRETAETNGVAHFMEHLIFKGTPTRKPGEIDAAFEDLGGSPNAATSYDWAHFYATVGSSDADAALAILSDAVMHASLRQEDIDSERSVILSEMAREQGNPSGRMTQMFNSLTYPDHPYGRPLLGTEGSITNLKRQTILDFYHTYYAPANTTLVISGNISPEAGRGLATRAFGAWPARAVPGDKTLPQPEQTDIRIRNMSAPSRRGYLLLGFQAPSVRDKPGAWVMDVLMTLLGQGGNNRLNEDLVRRQKLATSISTNFLTQRDKGTMTVIAAFDPGNVDQVRNAILAEITTLRDAPISDEDLAAAKHALLASYLFDAQTNTGRADALGFYNTIDTYKYDTDYVSNFEAVTSEQVQATARRYLNPQAYTLVTLLPRVNPITASRR